MLNIFFLFLNFYTNLYMACKLSNYKFEISRDNTLIIFIISIAYNYLLKLSFLPFFKVALTLVALMIIIKKVFNEKIISLIQVCFFTLLIMIISEQLVGIIFNKLLSVELDHIVILFILNVSICLVGILIVNAKDFFFKLIIKKNNFNVDSSIISSIFVISTTIILLFNYSLAYKYFNNYFNNKIFVIFFIISVLYLIIVLTFLYTSYVSNKKTEKLKNKEEEYNQLKLYSNITERLVDDISKFKHDYNNIIFMMNGYLQDNDYDALKEYFSKEILKQNKYYDIPKLKKIKNSGLKGLLAAKMEQLIRDNMDVSLEILSDIELCNVDELDLCRIIGILLDNAYDGAKNTSEKFIGISFVKDEGLSITILNTFDDSININNIYKKGYSSKGESRGIGLYNVKEILNKKCPNVILNTHIEKNIFIQDLYIS